MNNSTRRHYFDKERNDFFNKICGYVSGFIKYAFENTEMQDVYEEWDELGVKTNIIYEIDSGFIVCTDVPRQGILPSMGFFSRIASHDKCPENIPEIIYTKENASYIADFYCNHFKIGELGFAIFIEADIEKWTGDLNDLEDDKKSHILYQIVSRTSKIKDKLEKKSVTINNSGNMNYNSPNSVINVNTFSEPELFRELIEEIRQSRASEDEKEAATQLIKELKEHHGKSSFREKYQEIMSNISSHVTVFSAIAPKLGALAQLL